MKNYITRNAIGFGVTASILSGIFFNMLYSSLNHKEYNMICVYAIAYGVAMFVSGFLWGYYDEVRKTRTDIGFLYHLITFIVVNTASIFQSVMVYKGKDWALGAVLQIVFWGIGLVAHYYFSRSSIKGASADETFV